MHALSPEEQKKQELYRDARSTDKYDAIWQSVNKCVFCDMREKYIFFEENGIVMTISLYAYIDGHFMIVPRRHVKATRELTQIEWDTIRKFMYIAKKMIKDVHGIKGMQLIQKDGSAAQSTVEHIHFHCIPFDAPDLCTWNYRKLQYTPLENVSLYKKDAKKILSYDSKYTRKYSNRSMLQVGCDVLLFNTKSQVLFQERADGAKLIPDTLTIPGGMIDNVDNTLESELQREVKEETGYEIEVKKLTLVASRITSLERRTVSRQLKAAYSQKQQFLWNTYALYDIPTDIRLVPGDDCKELVWIDTKDIQTHPRISPELKEAAQKAVQSRYV
jgi:histidine triad (HIT) family protein